jgi:hypothetical protein
MDQRCLNGISVKADFSLGLNSLAHLVFIKDKIEKLIPFPLSGYYNPFMIFKSSYNWREVILCVISTTLFILSHSS